MSKENKVATIIKGRVYSVNLYAPFYGKDVKVSSSSIKLFGKGTTLDNPGIKPEELLELLHIHYVEKESLSDKEEQVKETLSSLIDDLKK